MEAGAQPLRSIWPCCRASLPDTTEKMPATDPRFAAFADPDFAEESHGEPSGSHSHDEDGDDHERTDSEGDARSGSDGEEQEDEESGLGKGMLRDGFAGPSEKVVKPLTPEALAAFKAAQEKTGVIYISRIPPGMRPTKVRHLMSAYGEVGRVYLQQEGASVFDLVLFTWEVDVVS